MWFLTFPLSFELNRGHVGHVRLRWVSHGPLTLVGAIFEVTLKDCTILLILLLALAVRIIIVELTSVDQESAILGQASKALSYAFDKISIIDLALLPSLFAFTVIDSVLKPAHVLADFIIAPGLSFESSKSIVLVIFEISFVESPIDIQYAATAIFLVIAPIAKVVNSLHVNLRSESMSETSWAPLAIIERSSAQIFLAPF